MLLVASRRLAGALIVLAVVGSLVSVSAADDAATTPVPTEIDTAQAAPSDYKGKRAGLRVGDWQPSGLESVAGADYSETPSFEGYFEKDLDVRLSVESSVGFWMRSREREESDLTGTSTEETKSYLLPVFTALKFYPVKHLDRRWAPYLSAGVGLALGMEKRDTRGGAFAGLGESSTTATGFGYKAGTGVDWNLSKSFGVNLSGRYQWLRFDQELGGDKTFRGVLFESGITYRFRSD